MVCLYDNDKKEVNEISAPVSQPANNNYKEKIPKKKYFLTPINSLLMKFLNKFFFRICFSFFFI